MRGWVSAEAEEVVFSGTTNAVLKTRRAGMAWKEPRFHGLTKLDNNFYNEINYCTYIDKLIKTFGVTGNCVQMLTYGSIKRDSLCP